ncbi:MAG: hypothetical protein J1F11_06410 [Oscillospiraceae bacterium]|nr:hypothetical protein [Oscillospiraceae bacterium]
MEKKKLKILNDMRIYQEYQEPDNPFYDDFFDDSMPKEGRDGFISNDISRAVMILDYDTEELAEPISANGMFLLYGCIIDFRDSICCWYDSACKDMRAAENHCADILKTLHRAVRDGLSDSLCWMAVNALRCNYDRIDDDKLTIEHIRSLMNCLDEVTDYFKAMQDIDDRYNICADPMLIKEYNAVRQKMLSRFCEINSREDFMCDVDDRIKHNRSKQAQLMKNFKTRRRAEREKKKNERQEKLIHKAHTG